MEGLKDRVAIIGMGCTSFGELWDQSVESLVVEACTEAFEDAGIEAKDIQGAWLGTARSGHRGVALSNPLKLGTTPVTRIEAACATSTDALRNACYAVAAGILDIALVCGLEKNKDYGFAGTPVSPPSYPEVALSQTRPSLPMPSQFALLANAYFAKYGIDDQEGKRILAKIAVKNHRNGMDSPKAHYHREITLEEAINAPLVAKPLGLYDCCAVSDGCAAAIVVPSELASRYRNDFILVKGIGLACGDEYAQIDEDYDWTYWRENRAAAAMAYREAGLHHPREEIDIAMVHDCFTINELISYEDLGFCPAGRAKEDIDSGFFERGGGLPVNTDGGLKCFGHPTGATGMRMIYEIYKQMQGKAGARQIKKVNIGLTHNIGGWPGAFTATVAIFGKST
jgi:acetyl-CoA C-acetyltransferase